MSFPGIEFTIFRFKNLIIILRFFFNLFPKGTMIFDKDKNRKKLFMSFLRN